MKQQQNYIHKLAGRTSLLVVAIAVCTLFTACDNKEHKLESALPILDSRGVYVVCQGDEQGSTLAYVGFTSGATVGDWFQPNVGRELGPAATDGLVYGDKLYIATGAEGKVEVVNRKSRKSVGQIDMATLTGDTGSTPNGLAAADGVLYIATPQGVTAVDTVAFSLLRKYSAGVAASTLAVSHTTLFIGHPANADGTGGSVEAVSLATGESTTATGPLASSPATIVAATPYAFFLDGGGNGVAAGVRRLQGATVTTVTSAACMCIGGTKLYVSKPSATATAAPTLNVYDLQTAEERVFTTDVPPFPCLMEADPVTGHLFVASYQKDPQTGLAAHATGCQLTEYDSSGSRLKTYDIGVEPRAIFFDTFLNYVEY